MSDKVIGYKPSSPLLDGAIVKLIFAPEELQVANHGRPDLDDMIVLELSSRSDKVKVEVELYPTHTFIADNTGMKKGGVLRTIITLKDYVV